MICFLLLNKFVVVVWPKEQQQPILHQSVVVSNVQKVSRKSDWKVSGTRLVGSFQWKIFASNGMSEKVVRFFQVGIFQMEIHVPFLETKATFDTSFRPLWPF